MMWLDIKPHSQAHQAHSMLCNQPEHCMVALSRLELPAMNGVYLKHMCKGMCTVQPPIPQLKLPSVMLSASLAYRGTQSD